MNDLKSTICKRCGRKLKNTKAIELGMGATCWRKFQWEDKYKKLWKKEEESNNEID